MYAIVRKENGEFYMSVVFAQYNYKKHIFAYYRDLFYVAFDEKKERLIKKYLFPKGLDPQIIVLDSDKNQIGRIADVAG